MSENPPSNRTKASIPKACQLVSPTQSRKLAALRDRAWGLEIQPAVVPASPINTALSEDAAAELCKARKLIDERCAAIMGGFPPLKQTKLFTLRFGTMEALKMLSVSTIFKRLGMDTQTIKLRLLAKLNYHGEEAGREKS